MSSSTPDLKQSVLIVAHPDDELLWFGSLLGEIGRVIVVFQEYANQPGLGSRRARALSELPYNPISLRIPEVGTYRAVDWNRPVRSPFGLELNGEQGSPDRTAAYQSSFSAICCRLEEQLTAVPNVFTHNPWGEYGHPDHVQVYRALETLAAQMGFTLRVSCYMSNRTEVLAGQYVDSMSLEPFHREIDQERVRDLSQVYERNDCWTWTKNWTWNDDDCFLSQPELKTTGHQQSLSLVSPFIRVIPG